MTQKTPPELTTTTSVSGSDLLLTWSGSGPLKSITASNFLSTLGALKDDFTNATAGNVGAAYTGYQARAGSTRTLVETKIRESVWTLSDSGSYAQGADITAELQSILDLAGAETALVGGSCTIKTPPCSYATSYVLSAPLFVPDGVTLDLTGTAFTRTGDYGPSIIFKGNALWYATKAAMDADLAHAANTLAVVYADTPANNHAWIKLGASGAGSWANLNTQSTFYPASSNVQIIGGLIWHNHGAVLFPPTTDGAWTNPTTTQAPHILAINPTYSRISDVRTYSMNGIAVYGGVETVVCNNYHYGEYDDLSAVRNDCLYGLRLSGAYTFTRAYATAVDVHSNFIGGPVAAAANITYPGAAGPISNTRNIGPYACLEIDACEGIFLDSNYFGAGNYADILFKPFTGSPCSDIASTNDFFDAAGYTVGSGAIVVEPQDASGYVSRLQITNFQANGQENSFRFFTDRNAPGAISVSTFLLKGQINSHIGCPIELYKVRGYKSSNAIMAWNSKALYSAGTSPRYADGYYIDTGSLGVDINDTFGGTTVFGTNANTINGVYAVNGATSNVRVTGLNSGISGRLYIGDPTSFAPDADYTLTPGTSNPDQLHLAPLTANRTATLSNTAGVANGNILDQFLISRVGNTDKFVLTVDQGAAGTVKILSGEWAIFQIATDGNWRLFAFGENVSTGTTVANLPPAASSTYKRRIVTDATVTTFASVVAGGGANLVPVWSTGANWIIG